MIKSAQHSSTSYEINLFYGKGNRREVPQKYHVADELYNCTKIVEAQAESLVLSPDISGEDLHPNRRPGGESLT